MNLKLESFEENKNLSKIIFKETTEFLKKEEKKFKDNTFIKIYEDINNYLYEHQYNFISQVFKEIKKYLLHNSTVSYISPKIKDFFKSINFDAERFRIKIYQENKKELQEAITDQFIYNRLKNAFDGYCFEKITLDDLNKNYPQSIIINNFFDYLIKENGFTEIIKDKIDKEIKNKMDELNELKKELNELEKDI